jgi:hypothetical protein
MKCNEVQRVLPERLEGEQDSEFLAHVESCPVCAELVSDLKTISAAAAQLAESEEPAPRVWVRIAAELRSEGLIREPESQPAGPVLVPGERRRWNARWLVPVAAALIAVGSYVVNHRPAPQVANQQPPLTTPIAKDAPDSSAQVKNPKPADEAANRKPSGAAAPAGEEQNSSAPMATVSLDDQQFLDQVSGRSATMKATYESQLRSVNSYIRDAEAYLKRNPADQDARRQLMEAYEQKAMLYQMALDHVQ